MKRAFAVFQLLCALGIIVWLTREVSWDDLKRTLPAASLWALGLLFLLRCVIYTHLGGRLAALSRRRLPMRRTVPAAIFCISANTLLPARLGEVFKIAWLKREGTVGIPELLSVVVVERLMDVCCLFTLASLFGAAALPPHLIQALPFVLGLLLAGFFLLRRYGSRLPRLLALTRERLLSLIPPLLREGVSRFAAALASLKDKRLLATAALISVGLWTCNFLHVTIITHWVVPLSLSLHETGLLCAVLFGSSALTAVPGGIGIMEGSVTATLIFFGVDKADALAVALWHRLYHSFVPLGLATVLLLFSPDLRSAFTRRS